MRPDDLAIARSLSLFQAMSDDTFGRMMAASLVQTFPAGVVLLEQGQLSDFLFVLFEGSVELSARHCNSEGAISIAQPGEPFAIAALLTDQPTLCQARTIGMCRALMIPAASLRDAIATDRAFCQSLLIEQANIVRHLIREINNQKLRNSTERLANWVLRARSKSTEDGPIQLPFRKRTLAALLGMTPENLSRTIASLEPHGVTFKGSSIAIADPDALRRVARPSELIDRI
jgi:CRP/FNR family transcriptional activator FtrB